MTTDPVNDVEEPETEDILDERVALQDLSETDPSFIPPDEDNDGIPGERNV